MKEKSRRDDLKLKIEEDQVEKLNAIDDYAKGLDPTMNQAMIKYAQNYKNYLMTSHNLMKNGLISVNDTKIKKQGASDTFKAINDVTKVYNEKIGAFIETGGSLNDFIAKKVAGALDISKSELIIDDMGRGSFVTRDESGNEIVVPATSINTILNEQYDRFNTTNEVVNVVKGISNWTLTSKGGYKSVSDFRQRGEDFYKDTLKSKVKSILNSDKKILEAAADMMNMDVTYDEKLAKENPGQYILAKNEGGKIVFDVEGIRETVEEGLYNQIDAAIGRTEQERSRPVGPRPPAGDKVDKNVASLIENFVSMGDFSSLQSALSEKGFVGSKAPDKDGVLRLIDGNGNEYKVNTKNRNAQQVGEEIAGHVGVGKFFKDRGVKGSLNTSVLDPTNSSKYNVFVTGPKKVKRVDESFVSGLQMAFNSKQWRSVLAETKNMANDAGVSANRITYNPRTGKLKLDGKVIGDMSSSARDIADKLEKSVQSEKTNTPPPSDIRLKEDINLIGVSESGINIYSWKYKKGVYDNGIFTGVIAQEVPWATIQVGDYLHVDYSKVDVEFNKIA